MGYGFLILFAALYALGWLVWGRILNRRAPQLLVQFGLTFIASFLVWHALVLYPVYDLRRSLTYDDVIRIIEAKSEVRFDPFAPVLGFWGGSTLSGGLAACGELCSRGYCEKGLKQEFIYQVNSHHARDESGAKKLVPSQLYIQSYSGACPNQVINSEKIEIKDLPKNIPPYLPEMEFIYNIFYELLSVKFKILVFNNDKNFGSAQVYMDKMGSWLEGMPDDEMGGRDREPIMKFNWLDVLRAGQ